MLKKHFILDMQNYDISTESAKNNRAEMVFSPHFRTVELFFRTLTLFYSRFIMSSITFPPYFSPNIFSQI